jgi:SAM-dependent methyltransferase
MRARCDTCGLNFANPLPSESDLIDYNASYFATAHGGIPTNLVSRAFFSAVSRLRLAYLDKYLGAQRVDVSRIMEFGPGPGFFAASWLERHKGTTYLACETDTSCHAALAELGVRLIKSDQLNDSSTPVDLVVISHVLEHVSEPKAFLEHATKSLRKGGVLFIEVPCMDFEHKPIDEPHLLFFDKKPMQYLLYASGFDHIELAYFGQEIDSLRSTSRFKKTWRALRSRMIGRGLIKPFSSKCLGMEALSNPLERAIVAPFKAHCESSKPAWWLRAIAIKK